MFLVLLSALLASRWLFKPGYFMMHDDLQMMRQLEMEKCWKDGQIPCRWVPDMGFGYGFPLFNFYPPLPYYLGQVFRLLKFSFVDTSKALFALQFFLSGAAMFILASDLWGMWGGLISAVFYIWAPYHSVDVFVRGAMNEAWAFIWFPLIFWSIKKLIEKEKLRYLKWLAFSVAMQMLTHSVMVMIFIPVALVWTLYWMIVYKKFSWQNRRLFLKFLLAGVWALGLAAFFTLPMIIEKKFTHIETMFSGYFDWRAHFVSFYQLFISRFWGYGPSLWQLADGMPFPVGHIHWMLALIIVFMVFWKKIRKINTSYFILHTSYLVFGLFAFGLGYAFLAHQRSVFIWLLVKPLQLAQFPWRLLAGVVFCFSLLAGAAAKVFKRKFVYLFLIAVVIIFNWNYFKPGWMGPLSDEEKFSGKAWEFQQTAGIYDYLPATAPKAPIFAPVSDYEILEGSAENVWTRKGTNWFEWNGEVLKEGKLMISILYFPGWKVWVNGEKLRNVETDRELGRMIVNLPEGQQKIYFRFTNTPARSWANLISLLSWWCLFLAVFGKKFCFERSNIKNKKLND